MSDAQQTSQRRTRQHDTNSRPTSCSSWWFVFVGGYQIFFAWRFGTFYEGEQGDLRKLYRGVAMERPYADIGILAFVVARVAPPGVTGNRVIRLGDAQRGLVVRFADQDRAADGRDDARTRADLGIDAGVGAL